MQVDDAFTQIGEAVIEALGSVGVGFVRDCCPLHDSNFGFLLDVCFLGVGVRKQYLTLTSSLNNSLPLRFPPTRPQKLSYTWSSFSSTLLTSHSGCFGSGRRRKGILSVAGVCFHRGECSGMDVESDDDWSLSCLRLSPDDTERVVVWKTW